jgi:hypothetical protein
MPPPSGDQPKPTPGNDGPGQASLASTSSPVDDGNWEEAVKAARRVRRRRVVRQAFDSSAEFADVAGEIVIEFISGILP